jgi:hypothetical protein
MSCDFGPSRTRRTKPDRSDAGDGFHGEGAPAPLGRRWLVRWYASQPRARLASPKRKSTVQSARTHRLVLRARGQIASDRPSVAGTPADERFANAASDTSKINFKRLRQTGSTPTLRFRRRRAGASGDGLARQAPFTRPDTLWLNRLKLRSIVFLSDASF